MDIERLRDDCRAYLKEHPANQDDLAEEIGVSHSWLNKFVNGQFPNVRLQRLQHVCNWVQRDRAARRRRAG